MKKITRVLLFTLATMVSAYGLSSCSSDGYSLNDMYGSIATVQVDDEGRAKSFTLDNGETMFVASSATAYKPRNERVMINYTILDDDYYGYDYAIKLNGYFEDVLTKPIIYIPADDQVQQDSIGYKPIKVFTMWTGGNYLNVGFGYNTSGVGTHLINMLSATDKLVQEGDQPIELAFRHNIKDDTEHYGSGKIHVSFKLDDYIVANKGKESITFKITWTNYDGTAGAETIKYELPKAIVDPPVVEE